MTSLLVAVVIAFAFGFVYATDDVDSYPEDFDCPMRQLALQFAMEIQPHLSAEQLQQIADALNGAQEAVNRSCVSVDDSWPIKYTMPRSWPDLYVVDETPSIYVDYVGGDDDNDGLIDAPFQHLDFAVRFARSKYGAQTFKRIILRAGKHYLRRTVELTPDDSNLLITNYNREQVELLGGQPLRDCKWTKTSADGDIWQCQLNDAILNGSTINGLRVNGRRAIRARYPNGNPEVFPCGFCSELQALSWVQPTCNPEPIVEYYPEEPLRNDTTDGYFQRYDLGVGGCCDVFTPNAGYWCSSQNQGGGAFTYRIPSGMMINNSPGVLPNSPYADLEGAVIQTWRPDHWSSWMFEVDAAQYDAESGKILFSKGGFQGARGNDNGDNFFIENVWEELDSAEEWFFNASTKILYYYANGTAPGDLLFETTGLKELVSCKGTMANPVKNQMLRGVTLKDSQYTYLDPHGMPSGGDWGLQRTGAIYLEGVDNVTITGNLFTRLDGNVISVNRYARNVVITQNEFAWIGDTVVSMWGDTEGIEFPDGTTMGPDGTQGNQPRGTVFQQNFVHEIGIFEKQSSMWFQAKSCSNVLSNNIFFNGPRAGINFNDGFGGNSTVNKNLLFNTCRESGDHGPFNSWDRQVYVTALRGTPSVLKLDDEIARNFMIVNYNADEAIDNDDGSCYYNTHHNFFVYGKNGMKNDFGGHDNKHHDNIYAYVSQHCFGIVPQLEGYRDGFHNNTCIITGSTTEYASFDCDAESSENAWPKLGDNSIYMTSVDLDPSTVGLCKLNETAFQATYPGADDGTKVYKAPNNQQLLAEAKELLFN